MAAVAADTHGAPPEAVRPTRHNSQAATEAAAPATAKPAEEAAVAGLVLEVLEVASVEHVAGEAAAAERRARKVAALLRDPRQHQRVAMHEERKYDAPLAIRSAPVARAFAYERLLCGEATLPWAAFN